MDFIISDELCEKQEWLIYYHPIRTIELGMKLKVRKGEVAILYIDGKMSDSYEEGMYSLPGEMDRLIKRYVKILTLITSVDLYFIQQTTNFICPWGLSSGFTLYDSQRNRTVSLGAYGSLSFYIDNYERFITEKIGVSLKPGQCLTMDDMQCEFISVVTMQFKASVMKTLAEKNNISVRNLATTYGEVAYRIKDDLNEYFAKYGFIINQFVIEAMNERK